MKAKKAKKWRTEQAADKYLQHLSKEGVDGSEALLDNFLNSKNVYYDAYFLDEIIKLLAEKKLIKEVDGTISMIGYFEPKKDAEPGKILPPSDWLGSVEGAIRQCEITAKGKDFVSKGQELDTVGVAERKATRAKWIEKVVTFIITVLTAVVVTWFTEPVKHWWTARDNTKTVNESSTVRPSFDSRQRSKSGESVDTTTKRGGPSRRFSNRRIY